MISLAYLELASILHSMGREAEAAEADRLAISVSGTDPSAPMPPADFTHWDDWPKGANFNDRGYIAIQAGRTHEAIDLLRLSVFHCRRAGDTEGEVIALENLYSALRAAQGYREATEVLLELTGPLVRGSFKEKTADYRRMITQTFALLEEVGDPIVIRDSARNEDIERARVERHAETLQQRKLLFVSDNQDVLETLANIPREERLRFVKDFAAHIRSARTGESS